MALRAARNASIALRAGITTLRDLGEVGELGVVFREAIEDGSVNGPRLIVAREWISRTGGHAWFAARQADGETDVRRAVREQARGGSDWAKIMVTGGILTPSSVPISRGFSDVEIEAAVSEAQPARSPDLGARDRRRRAHGLHPSGRQLRRARPTSRPTTIST